MGLTSFENDTGMPFLLFERLPSNYHVSSLLAALVRAISIPPACSQSKAVLTRRHSTPYLKPVHVEKSVLATSARSWRPISSWSRHSVLDSSPSQAYCAAKKT